MDNSRDSRGKIRLARRPAIGDLCAVPIGSNFRIGKIVGDIDGNGTEVLFSPGDLMEVGECSVFFVPCCWLRGTAAGLVGQYFGSTEVAEAAFRLHMTREGLAAIGDK